MRSLGLAELEYILLAARWTLVLSLVAILGGAVLGAVLTVLGISRNRASRVAVTCLTQFVQGTPLLVLLMMTYFGLSAAGLEIGAFTAASAALIVYAGAFLTSIWRGSIDAVAAGQWEGAAALGLRRSQILCLVIVPQAWRIALPPSCGFIVQVIKNTSLAAIIGFIEVTRAGQMVSNATFQPLPAFGAAAAIYFVLCLPFTLLTEWLEQRPNTSTPS
jgi:polar amino acid transport system permease protein